jgi:drug/metabolite transporter (DMT)-like permease
MFPFTASRNFSTLPALTHDRLAVDGVACCVVSALAYTVANVCMRQLTTLGCDPIWAVFNRELVTTVAIGPWLLYKSSDGGVLFPRGGTLVRILLVGLLIEVVGNVGVQWALGIVGLAITIPAVYGAMLAGGAILGHFLLKERVTFRSMVAIGVVLTALVLLGMGAETAGRSMDASGAIPREARVLILGVAAAVLGGGVFALLNITIRHSVTRTTRPTAVALLVPLMGVVSLGPLCLFRLGVEPLSHTPWHQAALMLTAGAFNLIGFLALVNGLQRITVVHANIISASQVAMAAVAGVFLFQESPNPSLLLGVCLTVIGILGFDRPSDGGVA